MQDFRQLKVWEKSHKLALSIYEATSRFPAAERYGLTAQLRRSASSVPSNIAEGCGRGSNADLVRFLHIAMGSALEADYQLQLARDLTYLDSESHAALNAQTDEVKRMLSALIRTIGGVDSNGGSTRQPTHDLRLTTEN
ncbi:MAG: four helix bundle protein [Dehalococcoidia bacterium]